MRKRKSKTPEEKRWEYTGPGPITTNRTVQTQHQEGTVVCVGEGNGVMNAKPQTGKK